MKYNVTDTKLNLVQEVKLNYKNIIYSCTNHVAEIQLNRPDALNAFNMDLITEIESALNTVKESPKTKILVFSANGRAFSAGADLIYFKSVLSNPKDLQKYIRKLNQVFFMIEQLPIPTLCVVQGFALAGGLELMLCCDVIIASRSAQFGDQHINFGLIPGGGSSRRLTERIGKQQAFELMISGRWMSSEEALKIQLIYKVVDDQELKDTVTEFTSNISSKSRASLSNIKTLINHSNYASRYVAISFENEMFIKYVSSHEDPSEGLNAFSEKRKPNFD